MKLLTVFIILLGFFSCGLLAKEKVPAEKVTEEEGALAFSQADDLQNRLNAMMQNTASWLDSIGSEDSQGASAAGYLQLSWLPRTADLAEFDAKFKVYFNLPRWDDRLALVIDNDNEDELLLDYETDHNAVNQTGVNVALQYIKQFNNEWQIKNRVGISRSQLYLRSEMQFNWQMNNTVLRLQPRLDYFLQDGWGPGVKAVLNYQLEKSYLSLSASWQKIQNESKSRQKLGFFHIKSISQTQLLVSGVQFNKSINKEDIANETYIASTRYRNLIYKSWMYFEVEPFIEFNQLNDFKREFGIALNLISYYGE